jgi:hypothetical protein
MVGKDKDGWKKADEHLTILMDQEHMITIEDTNTAIKRCEQHLQRAATDEASPKAKVLATEVEISGQDTAAELAALKATTKAQDAKIKGLSTQLRGDTSGAKRARNGVIDSIDFTWAQSSPNRSEPEDLNHDFITLTGIKVGHVRAN